MNNYEIIPKNVKSTIKEAVYIEDDEFIRQGWAREAEINGIILHTFESPEDFLSKNQTFNPSIPFYIDSNFGEGHIRGEILAKKLFAMGYKNLFLTTGYSPDKFKGITWIKGVVDKFPPWSDHSAVEHCQQ